MDVVDVYNIGSGSWSIKHLSVARYALSGAYTSYITTLHANVLGFSGGESNVNGTRVLYDVVDIFP